MLGWLADDDVSLSLDAATGLVTRHASSTSQVVGTDVFSVLEDEIAAGPDDALWVGYLGYASRPDLPARPGTVVAAPNPPCPFPRKTDMEADARFDAARSSLPIPPSVSR